MIKARKLTQAQERVLKHLRNGDQLWSGVGGAWIGTGVRTIPVSNRTIMVLRARRMVVCVRHSPTLFEYKLAGDS
jgi:hypothetical protein